jgi:hypothetical protein
MKTAKLKVPINGYSNIELVEKIGYQWKAIICGSGKEIMIYEDEFILDV